MCSTLKKEFQFHLHLPLNVTYIKTQQYRMEYDGGRQLELNWFISYHTSVQKARKNMHVGAK